MSVVELKKRIIDKIGAIEDETILEEIYNRTCHCQTKDRVMRSRSISGGF